MYPFIALNLLFSLQAAYAAPLILLAQTRQADRDKMHSERVEKSQSRLERAAKAETDKFFELLQSNTDLTQHHGRRSLHTGRCRSGGSSHYRRASETTMIGGDKSMGGQPWRVPSPAQP